jgi:hypothetical protein
MRFKRTDNGAEVADGSSVAFPQTTIGAPVLLELAICNDGPGSLIFPNATTDKVSGSGFTQMSYVPPGLAPGLCMPFGVRFTGSSLGTFNGSITVDNSDADENPYNIALSATVVASPPPAPEIRVKRADTGAEIANGGFFTFPQTPVGNLPISQAFSICNDGTGSLTLDTTLALVSGSQFTQVGSPPAATVAPGACTNLSVQFSASNPGLYNGAISIGNNDANENPYTIALGATAAQNSPQIHVQSQTVTRQGSSQIRGVDQVLVTDQNNQPVAGVLVRATYSGPNQGQVSGTTGSNGRVTLQASQVRRPQGKWCFQITSLSKSGYTYNSAANVVTVQCE